SPTLAARDCSLGITRHRAALSGIFMLIVQLIVMSGWVRPPQGGPVRVAGTATLSSPAPMIAVVMPGL
ncbi:MAG: hypothetical protein ACXV8W_14975, partial [Methylobacter sp.]